jgi:hypothetical protein
MNDAIEALLSKQQITELTYRYMRGLDRWDRALLLSLFHADAWCAYGFLDGEPELFVDHALDALSCHVANHHFVGNILIDLEGDEAFGEVYFNAYHKLPAGEGFEDLLIAGRYLDRYERRDGCWKFAYRSERVDWSHSRPSHDPYFQLVPNGLVGARTDDAVYDRGARYRPRKAR